MSTLIGKVGMVMKGVWDSSLSYEILDAVTYNNGLYIAKQNVPANTVPTNTTYWQSAIDYNAVDRLTTAQLNAMKGENITAINGGIIKVGRLVSISITWTGNITGTPPILTLPEAYRPAVFFQAAHFLYSTVQNAYIPGAIVIDTDGTIYDGTTQSGKTSGFISCSYYV